MKVKVYIQRYHYFGLPKKNIYYFEKREIQQQRLIQTLDSGRNRLSEYYMINLYLRCLGDARNIARSGRGCYEAIHIKSGKVGAISKSNVWSLQIFSRGRQKEDNGLSLQHRVIYDILQCLSLQLGYTLTHADSEALYRDFIANIGFVVAGAQVVCRCAFNT